MPLYRAHRFTDHQQNSGIILNPYLEIPRRPMTMPQKMHEICGLWFEERFGINFRSRALFCTGDRSQAEKYLDDTNTLIEITPIGAFKACYSEQVRDLFDHLIDNQIIGYQKTKEEIINYLDSLGYVLTNYPDLAQAEISCCEIMLYSDSFSFKKA